MVEQKEKGKEEPRKLPSSWTITTRPQGDKDERGRVEKLNRLSI